MKLGHVNGTNKTAAFPKEMAVYIPPAVNIPFAENTKTHYLSLIFFKIFNKHFKCVQYIMMTLTDWVEINLNRR